MNTYIESLLKFMDSSVCNFLAVDTIKKVLVANGFVEKRLEDAFTCQGGEKFFVTKKNSKPVTLKDAKSYGTLDRVKEINDMDAKSNNSNSSGSKPQKNTK